MARISPSQTVLSYWGWSQDEYKLLWSRFHWSRGWQICHIMHVVILWHRLLSTGDWADTTKLTSPKATDCTQDSGLEGFLLPSNWCPLSRPIAFIFPCTQSSTRSKYWDILTKGTQVELTTELMEGLNQSNTLSICRYIIYKTMPSEINLMCKGKSDLYFDLIFNLLSRVKLSPLPFTRITWKNKRVCSTSS